jgi:uncharacterized protein (UPF0332 family)
MTEAVHELLDKSEQSINAANLLLGDGYDDFAASRAYYAMFYAVEALMLDRDLSFSKHSAVIAAFGKLFVKTGIFDSRFHRSLLNAFDLRNAGDYGSTGTVSRNEASQIIAEAGELLAEIKRHLAAD